MKKNVCKRCGEKQAMNTEFCYGCLIVKKAFPDDDKNKISSADQAIIDQTKAWADLNIRY